MRVLLVDDDEEFRATLRHLLTQRGRPVQVEEAADGEEALRMVANSLPDVVLMDLTMPHMNGMEATRRLKSRWPRLPVIILTVHDDPVYERTAQAAGADGFLVKKTAGTRLWPALVPLAARGSRATPGGAMTAIPPARRGVGRAWIREATAPAFEDRSDCRARPSPLQAPARVRDGWPQPGWAQR
jgi:DNA-binding NarL/FixJ family response regulator